MTNEPSPRPWTFCPTYGEHRPNSIIVDADGGNVALVCHFTNEEEENRIGNLIVDAVNHIDRLRDELDVERSQHCTDIEQVEYHEEHRRKILEAERDRLRDLVRRLVNQFGNLTSYEDDAAILREARAAIGEDAR